MDNLLLNQSAWSYGFLIASLQMFALVLVCYLRLTIEMFRRREYLIGGLFAALFLVFGGGWCIGVVVGLPVGWKYASRWGLRSWMAVYSALLAAGLANLAIGFWVKFLTVEEWKQWFGWVPAF